MPFEPRMLTLDAIPLATIAFDREACVLTWNKAAETLFGWSAEEVIGKANPIVPAGGRATSDDLFERIMDGEPVNGVEVERYTRDGRKLDLALFSSPLDDGSGALVLYADVSDEIAARRERDDAQRNYRSLVESLPLVTYIDEVDEHATNVYTSPQVTELLGWHPEDWIVQADFFEQILHPDDRARVLSQVNESNETHVPFESEYRLRHRDGHYVWVRDHSSIIANDGGEPLARGFLLDITEQKRLEAQLLQSQKMDALGQLAGGIAHDFNNLLTGIGGYAELAAQHAGGDPVLERSLAGIQLAAAEAASLTAQLLTFGRRHMPERTVVDANVVVGEAAEFLERLVRADVLLDVSLAGALPLVDADPAQLKQVVLNLALNARDAMPEGGSLSLETRQVGDSVVICVRDTGAGMDEQTLARALEPFFTTKPMGEGTGLGLAVVYGVVRSLGGTFRLESEPGKGTTAEIVLPASRGSLVPKPAAAPAPVATRLGARILVAEDRELVRGLTREVLQGAGFVVETAASGAEAIDAWRRAGPFDLLLSDVVMPGMNGPELARRLRELSSELPVLFMSGYSDDVLGPAELARPRTGLIHKPCSNARLVAAVNAAIAGHWADAAFANASSSSPATPDG